MGTDRGNTPQGTFTAVAEMADLDALGAVGRSDAAQLIGETGNRVADIARIEGKAAAHAVVNAALAAGLSGGLVDDSSASAPYAAKTGWAYCG